MSANHSKNLTAEEFLSVTDARHEFFNMLDEVEKSARSYTLTRKGRPIAKLLNFEQWKGILTTLEILVSPSHRSKLDKRITQARRGKTVSLDEIFEHD